MPPESRPASSFAIEVPGTLLARARAGDHAAFEQVYRWFERPVFTLALRICGDREEAADVLQDTMLKVIDRIGDFRGDSPFWGWLRMIAVNEALMRVRRVRSHPDGLELDAQEHADDLQPDLLGWTLIAHGKGGKDRRVPLEDDLAREVAVQADGGWLLPGRIDGHLSGAYVGKLVARALPGVWTMHTLRHRFGTLAADGGDLIAVQRLLGHASVATTQRYVLRPDDALRRAARLAAA